MHPPSKKKPHQLHHKSDPSPLLSTGDTIPDVLGPVLHSSVGKRHEENLAKGPGQAALGDPARQGDLPEVNGPSRGPCQAHLGCDPGSLQPVHSHSLTSFVRATGIQKQQLRPV